MRKAKEPTRGGMQASKRAAAAILVVVVSANEEPQWAFSNSPDAIGTSADKPFGKFIPVMVAVQESQEILLEAPGSFASKNQISSNDIGNRETLQQATWGTTSHENIGTSLGTFCVGEKEGRIVSRTHAQNRT